MVQSTSSNHSATETSNALSERAWISRFVTPLQGEETGQLGDLRFAVKDNIDTVGLRTTAACESFAYRPTTHATVVHKLLNAGAQLVGKTNLDQFACGLNGTRSPWGAVPNAINPLYVSGGSSSGSAYVVATGQVDFALGTDTAGSGRVPAGLNNIVGLKPSKGLISARGVVPAAQSVDCVSIFARTVATAARVLESACGYDALDPFSRELSMASQPFSSGWRYGVPNRLDFFGDAHAERAFTQARAQLQVLGGVEVIIDFAPFAEAASLLYESALVSERYVAIREFFDAHEGEVMEPVRSIISKGRAYSAADLYVAQLQLRALEKRATAIWKSMDVMCVPTAPTHYTITQMQADPVALNRNLGAYTNFVNLLDYAALSVPSSMRPDGLPFGITLIGPAGSDWQLAELGQRYHHATGLKQGATAQPLPPPQPIPGIKPAATVRVAVVGAHLSGMPLNSQLTERGGHLLARTTTAPHYRFYALPGTVPPKPGLQRVADGTGGRIALEIWELPLANFGSFVALVPAPLCIGTLTLDDGSSVQGFLCEARAIEGALDITAYGGWRAYIDSIKKS